MEKSLKMRGNYSSIFHLPMDINNPQSMAASRHSSSESPGHVSSVPYRELLEGREGEREEEREEGKRKAKGKRKGKGKGKEKGERKRGGKRKRGKGKQGKRKRRQSKNVVYHP